MIYKMKKIFLSLALIFGASGIFAASAATQSENSASQEVQENVQKEGKGKKHDKHMSPRGGNPMRFNSPFEGIDLTQEQKDQLAELQKSLAPEKIEKGNGEGKDSLSKDEKRKLRMELQAKRDENRKAYLEGVKKILNPEQYIVFLENSYLNQNELGIPSPRKMKVKDPRDREGRKR